MVTWLFYLALACAVPTTQACNALRSLWSRPSTEGDRLGIIKMPKLSRDAKEVVVTGCTVAGAGLGAEAGMAAGAAAGATAGGPVGGVAGGFAGGVAGGAAGGVGGYVVGKTVVETIEIIEDPAAYVQDKAMKLAKWQLGGF